MHRIMHLIADITGSAFDNQKRNSNNNIKGVGAALKKILTIHRALLAPLLLDANKTVDYEP
jgi:hypothetical protein